MTICSTRPAPNTCPSWACKSSVIKTALKKARSAQEEFKQQVIEMGAEVIRDSEASGRPLILLMGRPYHIDPLINHNVPDLLTDFGVDVITEDCIPMTGEALDNRHVMTQWEYINRYFHAARWVGQHENVELVQLNSFGCGPDPFILDEVRAILAELRQTSHRHPDRRDRERRFDQAASALDDGIPATVGMQNHSNRVRIPRKSTKSYEPEDRDPHPDRARFFPVHLPADRAPVHRPGLPDCTTARSRTTLRWMWGLKYTNNEICYPGIITLGDLVKALQSGDYDLARTAIGFSQTGGQCRATSYPSMIKKALVAAGFENVPVVTLSTSLSVAERPARAQVQHAAITSTKPPSA